MSLFYFAFANLCFAEQEYKNIPEIVVQDTRYEQIYIQKPIIKGNNLGEVSFNNEEEIFVQMNMSAHNIDKNISIYNDYNIGFLYGENKCDYISNPLKCSIENNHWLLQPIVTLDKNRHTISLILYNERGEVVSQATKTSKKKIKIINKKTTTSSLPRGVAGVRPNCTTSSCGPIPMGGIPSQTTEQVEPMRIDQPPALTSYEIHQAVMMLCLSMKK